MEREILDRLVQVVARLTAITEGMEKAYEDRDENILISCTEAARILGKTAPTISAMLKDGRLNKTTIGISTGIRLSEVLARR